MLLGFLFVQPLNADVLCHTYLGLGNCCSDDIKAFKLLATYMLEHHEVVDQKLDLGLEEIPHGLSSSRLLSLVQLLVRHEPGRRRNNNVLFLSHYNIDSLFKCTWWQDPSPWR